MASIQQAERVDPSYPDPHFFGGMIDLQDRKDPSDAVTEFETYLADHPPSDMLPEVQGDADNRVFYAIPLLALLIWWASRWFPDKREFLRTGAFVLIGVGILYALYLLVA